jgi:hypothetical protein
MARMLQVLVAKKPSKSTDSIFKTRERCFSIATSMAAAPVRQGNVQTMNAKRDTDQSIQTSPLPS